MDSNILNICNILTNVLQFEEDWIITGGVARKASDFKVGHD